MSMFNCNCNCKFSCTLAAVIASIIIGVVAAFLQVTAVITVAPAFLWVALGIAAVYLAVTVIASAVSGESKKCCLCPAVNTILAGILGTALFSILLLGIGIVATSILSAIFVGILLFFLALTFTGTACLVKCLAGCSD